MTCMFDVHDCMLLTLSIKQPGYKEHQYKTQTCCEGLQQGCANFMHARCTISPSAAGYASCNTTFIPSYI